MRVFLSDGTMGLGVEGYAPIREPGMAFLKQMIGVSPESMFVWQSDRIAGHAPQYAAQLRDENNCWFE